MKALKRNKEGKFRGPTGPVRFYDRFLWVSVGPNGFCKSPEGSQGGPTGPLVSICVDLSRILSSGLDSTPL